MDMKTNNSNSNPAITGIGRTCKVTGCQVDLEALGKPYCLKKRMCVAHMRADAVTCEGHGDQLYRFCQQCGKLEPLNLFEGKKRSCRKGLHKRRLRETASAHAGDKDNMDDPTSDEAVETPVMTKSPQQQLQQTEVSADEAARDTRLSSGAETYHDRVHERVAVGTAAVPQISWTEQNLQRYMHDYSSPCNMFAAAGAAVRSPAAAAAAVLGTLLRPAAPAAVPVSQTSLIDSLLDEEMMNCIKEGGNEHLTAASTAELESLLETELLAAAAAAAVGPVASNVRSLMPYCQLAPYSPAYRNQHQQLAMTAATAATNNFAGRAASSLLGTEAAQVPAPPTLEVLQQKLTKIQSTLLKLKHLREQQLSAVQGYYSTATWEQYIGGFDMMTGLMQGGCLEGTPFEMHV